MPRPSPVDMFILRTGIDMLLEYVHRSVEWWHTSGDSKTLERTRRFERAIEATRRNFFMNVSDIDAGNARAIIVAEGLRDAATQCTEGQSALHARLVGAAETIEWLCHTREG